MATAAKKDQTLKGVSVEEMMAHAQKEMGDDIGKIGGEWEDVPRIPTGVLEFDIATGGGFPIKKVSIIYGNESASKTVHAMLAIASHQRMFPDKKCAYIALEGYGKNEREWFRKLGVDVDKLAVFQPTYAEQVVDIMDSLCWAIDIGLIVLDSLAAMMTVTEFENSAEKKSYGGASIPISTMVRKTTTALNKAPGQPTIIYITQTRTKMGIVYGNPETFAGGNFIRFQSALTVRLYGKNEMDTKINKIMPVLKTVTASVVKWKVPIIAMKAEYDLVMIPHKGLRCGQSDWWLSFLAYGKALGMITKAEGKGAKGWDAFGQNWPTQDSLKSLLYSDPDYATAICSDLIDMLSKNGDLIAPQEGDD